MAGASTKDRIIDAAIVLFNEKGSPAVSTNHIADAAGISPGNLYYHFRNKEEIIRAAYERALCEYDAVWAQAADAAPEPAAIVRLLEESFDAQWRFRFLQRELPTLVQHDESLKARYRDAQARRLAGYRALIEGWMAAGIARRLESQRLDDIALASWVIGDQWIAYLEATGGSSREGQVRRGARLVFEVVRPHLAEAVVAELDRRLS